MSERILTIDATGGNGLWLTYDPAGAIATCTNQANTGEYDDSRAAGSTTFERAGVYMHSVSDKRGRWIDNQFPQHSGVDVATETGWCPDGRLCVVGKMQHDDVMTLQKWPWTVGLGSIHSYELSVPHGLTYKVAGASEPVRFAWTDDDTFYLVHYGYDGATLKEGFHVQKFHDGALVWSNLLRDSGDYVWTERRPAGNADKNWMCAASDSDGSHFIAGVDGGRLYTSANAGVGWTERQPAGNSNQEWHSVASDADGSNLIVAAGNGRLFTSSDSGANWTERQPDGAADYLWMSVASDADGTHLMAAHGTRFYTSADSGATWTQRQSAHSGWDSVASDDNGSHLIAGDYYDLQTSADSGATWTEQRPAGDDAHAWPSVASDSDGTNLIAASWSTTHAGGRLYTSANSGSTWTERQPAGNVDHNWAIVASDGDGSHLLAISAPYSYGDYVFTSGRVYSSVDSGATWTEQMPAGDADHEWWAGASDGSGASLIVGKNPGRLYTFGPAALPQITLHACVPWDGGCLVLFSIDGVFHTTIYTAAGAKTEIVGFQEDNWQSWCDDYIDGTTLKIAYRAIYGGVDHLVWRSFDGHTWTAPATYESPAGRTIDSQATFAGGKLYGSEYDADSIGRLVIIDKPFTTPAVTYDNNAHPYSAFQVTAGRSGFFYNYLLDALWAQCGVAYYGPAESNAVWYMGI
jgi:hypothetical protein